MVHVEIEEIKPFCTFSPIEQAMTLFQVFHCKFAPSADADADRIPTQARLVGRLAEPEVTMVKELEFILFIKYGLMFATMLAIITPNADIIIAIQSLLHILELDIQHFLCSEYLRRHEVHLVANDLAALLPNFTLNAIVPILVTDIVGTDQHILGGKL